MGSKKSNTDGNREVGQKGSKRETLVPLTQLQGCENSGAGKVSILWNKGVE